MATKYLTEEEAVYQALLNSTCLCCGGDTLKVIEKKCGCWIFHFPKCPWEEVSDE